MKKQHKNVTYVFILLVNFQRNLVLAQNQIALRTQFPTKILGWSSVILPGNQTPQGLWKVSQKYDSDQFVVLKGIGFQVQQSNKSEARIFDS